MRGAAVVCATLLLACGCGSPPSDIRVDPEFNDDDAEVVVDALEEFFEEFPELRVPYAFGDNVGAGAVLQMQTSRCGDVSDGGIWGKTSLDDSGHPMRICSGILNSYALRQTLLHELGHAFSGRNTHLECGNIMALGPCDSWPDTYTDADRAYILGSAVDEAN